MMKSPRGLTLIELLVAVAVLSIIVAVAAPSMRGLIEVQRLRSINSQLVTDLQFARNEAAARGTLMRVVFRFSASATCYSLFTSAGTPAQTANSQRCDCLAGPGNACTDVPGTAEVRTVSYPRSLGVLVFPVDAVAAVAFDPATGSLVTIPTDLLSAPMNVFRVGTWVDEQRQFYNVLNQSGRPSVCSPVGSTLGQPPCS